MGTKEKRKNKPHQWQTTLPSPTCFAPTWKEYNDASNDMRKGSFGSYEAPHTPPKRCRHLSHAGACVAHINKFFIYIYLVKYKINP
jgi:hypothetical protein